MCTLFDSLTKEQDKLIQMGALRYSNGKDHSLIVQGSNNSKSKEKQIVKENKPKSDNEDESSNPTNEGSRKKIRKKEAHPTVLIVERNFILRRNVSRIIWKSCLNYLRRITLKFCMS